MMVFYLLLWGGIDKKKWENEEKSVVLLPKLSPKFPIGRKAPAGAFLPIGLRKKEGVFVFPVSCLASATITK